MKRRYLPRTFFGQLLVGTAVVQTLFLGIFIWFTVSSQSEQAEQRTRQRIVLQLNRLAAACSKQVAKGDLSAVHDVLELSRIAPTIEVARLTDLAGTTLAVSDSGRDHGLDAYERVALPEATKQQVFKIRNGQIEAVTPVLEGGRPVALLWLEPNHAVALNTLNAVVRVSLTYGIFALLANILPIFLIVQTMTRPLRRLQEATQRVMEDPDLNTGFPLPVTSTNEAGDLTTSVNAMVRELKDRRHGLLETLALLDSMLGNAPIGFGFFDGEHRYVRLNQSFADMSGWPVEEHLGRVVAEVGAGTMVEEMEFYLRQVFETGEAVRNVELSTEQGGVTGGRRNWLMHFYPVRPQGAGIRWVGVIVTEITERLQAEEALRKTEKLAAAGRLAASVAHEINNPLEAVTNLLYLLATHDRLDGTAMEFVTAAQSELMRVSEITQQMLRFYRQSTHPSRTDVAEVMRSVITLYQRRIASARIEVVERFDEGSQIVGYGGELRQLFANLIGNAVDAMPEGGVLWLRVRRGQVRLPDGTWCPGVRAVVADTGMGMSPETLQRIFEAFFTTKQVTGTGLGLWVSEEIIRKHTGTVRVRSRQGEKGGTVFLVSLPELGVKREGALLDGAGPSAGDHKLSRQPPYVAPEGALPKRHGPRRPEA